MAWDSLPENWTPVPVGRGVPVPEPKQKAPEPREEICYCGKRESVCVQENGSDCRHPFAVAHMWGD